MKNYKLNNLIKEELSKDLVLNKIKLIEDVYNFKGKIKNVPQTKTEIIYFISQGHPSYSYVKNIADQIGKDPDMYYERKKEIPSISTKSDIDPTSIFPKSKGRLGSDYTGD